MDDMPRDIVKELSDSERPEAVDELDALERSFASRARSTRRAASAQQLLQRLRTIDKPEPKPEPEPEFELQPEPELEPEPEPEREPEPELESATTPDSEVSMTSGAHGDRAGHPHSNRRDEAEAAENEPRDADEGAGVTDHDGITEDDAIAEEDAVTDAFTAGWTDEPSTDDSREAERGTPGESVARDGPASDHNAGAADPAPATPVSGGPSPGHHDAADQPAAATQREPPGATAPGAKEAPTDDSASREVNAPAPRSAGVERNETLSGVEAASAEVKELVDAVAEVCRESEPALSSGLEGARSRSLEGALSSGLEGAMTEEDSADADALLAEVQRLEDAEDLHAGQSDVDEHPAPASPGEPPGDAVATSISAETAQDQAQPAPPSRPVTGDDHADDAPGEVVARQAPTAEHEEIGARADTAPSGRRIEPAPSTRAADSGPRSERSTVRRQPARSAPPVPPSASHASDSQVLRDIDEALAENVEHLLQGSFESVSDVLDNVFDEQAESDEDAADETPILSAESPGDAADEMRAAAPSSRTADADPERALQTSDRAVETVDHGEAEAEGASVGQGDDAVAGQPALKGDAGAEIAGAAERDESPSAREGDDPAAPADSGSSEDDSRGESRDDARDGAGEMGDVAAPDRDELFESASFDCVEDVIGNEVGGQAADTSVQSPAPAREQGATVETSQEDATRREEKEQDEAEEPTAQVPDGDPEKASSDGSDSAAGDATGVADSVDLEFGLIHRIPLLQRILVAMNAPLWRLPPRGRMVMDWVALTLVFWVPIVWILVAFVV